MAVPLKEFEAALRKAYPTRPKLAQMVAHGLGENLEELAPPNDLTDTVFALVRWAESQGKLDALLDAACRESPTNPDLLALKRERAYGASPAVLPTRRVFVGREEELASIARALEESGRGSITQASVWGMGGVGKTALALEYAHRVRESGECPAGVWWLLAEGEPLGVMLRLLDMMRRRAPKVVASVPDNGPPEELAEELRLALEAQEQPSLLVLDNVDQDMTSLLPGGRVRVLLTTRDVGVAVGREVKLDVLSVEDAVSLAIEIAGPARNQAEEAARERVVVTTLGALAVAVEVAANAVRRWVDGWVAYEKLLATSIAVVDRDKHRSKHYPAGVFAALDVSMNKAGETARKLLLATVAFAPDAVPLEWAFGVAGLDAEAMEAQEARGELEGLGLVKVDKEKRLVSVHRLLHARVRERAEPKAWREVSRRAVSKVETWTKDTVGPAREQMDAIESRRAHIDEALASAERLEEHSAWILIADRLATHLQHRADYPKALSLFERALALAETTYGAKHFEVAAVLSNLALVHQDLGEAGKALPLLERALTIDETTYGSEDSRVAKDLSNLAMVHQDLGEVGKARLLLERALTIDETTYGPEHPDVATDLTILAGMHYYLGEASKARPLLERALTIDETTYGPEHPEVATDLSNLAMVHKALGEADKARPLLERSLAIRETTYGPEHPNVAVTLSNLALVHRALGEAGEARPLLERALAIAERMLGPAHPHTVLYRTNLTAVLSLLSQG